MVCFYKVQRSNSFQYPAAVVSYLLTNGKKWISDTGYKSSQLEAEGRNWMRREMEMRDRELKVLEQEGGKPGRRKEDVRHRRKERTRRGKA